MTHAPKEKHEEATPKPTCGIIMPISATASRSESQWANVQTLLHRVIGTAGFDAKNVWEGAATDRISERIISSIFRCDIVVADITDLNPNVMLELGLRLASKKPTIVVVSKGSAIPFDIRDFQAVDYPADMNMLGMEDFFNRLSTQLNEKYDAAQRESYQPFLSNVVIDVLAPKERPGTLDQVILNKLDDLSYRIQIIDDNRRSEKMAASAGITETHITDSQMNIYISCKEITNFDKMRTEIEKVPFFRSMEVIDESDSVSYVVFTFDLTPAGFKPNVLEAIVRKIALRHNAAVGMPSGGISRAQYKGRVRHRSIL
jgi:hypothetical protein